MAEKSSWSAKRAKLATMADQTVSEDECDPHDVDDHEKKDDEKILPHTQAFHESIQKDFHDLVTEILITYGGSKLQDKAPEPFGDGDNQQLRNQKSKEVRSKWTQMLVANLLVYLTSVQNPAD